MDSPRDDSFNAMPTQEEKEGESTMSYGYSQESYWENAAFYQQGLVTTPLDNGFLEQAPLGMTVSVLAPSEQRQKYSRTWAHV